MSRVAKEDTKISYIVDRTSFSYRQAIKDAGYNVGDRLDRKIFPTLHENT